MSVAAVEITGTRSASDSRNVGWDAIALGAVIATPAPVSNADFAAPRTGGAAGRAANAASLKAI